MRNDNEIALDDAQSASAGIRHAGQARSNLGLVRGRLGADAFSRLLPSIHALLRSAGDPDMSLNNLERFTAALRDPVELARACQDAPALLPSLIAVFGASRFLSTAILAQADDSLAVLRDPDFLHAPEKERLRGALEGLLLADPGEGGLFRALRAFRRREMLRIALRDLLGRAGLAETVNELSDLAEVCLQAAYERIDADLAKRHGMPVIVREDGTTTAAGFAVIAMGKLGGRELNFSSDIDLMYVYAADGETEGVPAEDGGATGRITNHQYFVKLAERLSAAIGRSTADGFVFRVDLRLRPEGQRGPLAQSLGGYEIYYESWGQTWERSALVKARFVAGSADTGREFLARIEPFVYRKYLDYGAIGEIREMKQKINREVQLKGRADRDVKLGYGGIREIEFLAQSLQLIYGGRDRTLRERGTMKALHILAQKGLLTYQESSDLLQAYVFLRTVEHRIQLLNDLQTQTMPAADDELRTLARRCGYGEPGREAEQLLQDHGAHTRKVRLVYDALLGRAPAESREEPAEAAVAVLLDPQAAEQDVVQVLGRSGFRDPSKACRNISLLREGQAFMHQTPRSRRVFGELFPLIYREITASPDPDMALNHLESYLASQGSWDAFQSLISQDARLLTVLVSVFGNSDYFSRLLVRSPSLLQDLLEGAPGLGQGARLRRDCAAAIDRSASAPDKLDALRRFKHREELRTGMADLAGAVPMTAVSRALSRLAECCLASALDLAAEETAKRFGGNGTARGLAVMGAGKLGGRELIYGSDLDILFVFDEDRAERPPQGMTAFELFSKVAEKTLAYLTTMTREGALYRVDTRLRPTGSKGTLVQSIAAFRDHFTGPAAVWERQALVNLRCVAGDWSVGNALVRTLEEHLYRVEEPSALAADVRSMRGRMEAELAREDASQYNLKQGAGGLVDIEFAVQFLKLLHGRSVPGLRVPGTINTLRRLRRAGLLSEADAGALTSSFLFLRRLESRLRVVENQSKSFLSRDPERLFTLSRRVGCADGKALLDEYERIRAVVRSTYDRLLTP